MKSLITIVIPCFNEERNLALLVRKLNEASSGISDIDFQYLFVDDGSYDDTFETIEQLCLEDNSIKAIQLSRNFGSHISITAGIENAVNSDAVIVISADLQEPPELIKELIETWMKGYEVVWTIREDRAQSFISKFFSRSFYKLFIKASGLKNYPKEGPSAYFLIDRKVVMQWEKFRETNRMIVGIIAWMGFNQTQIYYKQKERFSGKSSWSLMKLIKIAIDSFVSFSFTPIRFVSYLGILVSLIGFVYTLVLIYNKLFLGIGPTGWTSIMVVMLFLGGIQLITLGVIGEYVWRGVDESRKRPLYLVSKKVNFQKEELQEN